MMRPMNTREQEHQPHNDAPVLSAPAFKDQLADMERSPPSAPVYSSAPATAMAPEEHLALELSRSVTAPGGEHEQEGGLDSQSHDGAHAADESVQVLKSPAATVVAVAALSSLPSSSSPSAPSPLPSLASLEPTAPPAVLLATSSSSSSSFPHPPHAPDPPHSPPSTHSLRSLHSQPAQLFSSLAQHDLAEARSTGTLAESRLRIPPAAPHSRLLALGESLPRRKALHLGRTSTTPSPRTPPFVFAETLFISLGHSPFRLFVVTPLYRPTISAATLKLKLESQSFFCCCTPFDLDRCLGYFRTWSLQSLAVAYSIPLLCALTPGLVLPLSIFQVLSLMATTGLGSSSDPHSLQKMDPESSSNTYSRPSSQDRHHVHASESHSHVTMLGHSASQPSGSVGSSSSSSSSSPHQHRIPANMHHSAGSSSGAVFRPPSQPFTQHHQDQNHSSSSHSEQQPHPTRFDHTHSHHNQSRSYNSFHDFEEEEDEDRRSDDGSEGEPGFNDIEFWLQRCSICFDARLDFCLEFCRDQFCRECFQRYVKEVVSNSWGLNITKIKCPVCQDTIPLSEWTKYVDRATFAQYNQYNQPYRSFSRFCGGCEQEVVVSDVKRKVIGLPVQDLLPFFEGFLEDLRTLMEVGGLALEKPSCAAVSSAAKASLTRPAKGWKNEPEPSERDKLARRIVQRFVDDFQALCGVTHGPHPRFPSMAQSYLSSLTLRMGASLGSAPAPPASSQQASSLPHHQATSSSGSQVQGSNHNPNPQPTMESTTRLPISIFPRRLTAFSSNGVLELYKTLMVSLLDLFDLNYESQKTPIGDSIRTQADDIDMVLAPRHEPRNDTSTAPAQGISSDQPKLSVDDASSGSRTTHQARPRVMTRAMTKQQAAVKRALVRLSKDISSIETRPEQWKELQFLHVRWLRWDWCHTCDQELCLQCGVSTHHENMDCFAYMRSLIVGDIEPSVSRRKRSSKANDQEFSSTGRNGVKGKDRKDVDASTIQWKLSNTNPCPNCCILIHRDDGCNKVDCMLCGHRFCWICREAWGVGCGFFKCGRQPVDAVPSNADHPEGAANESDDGAPSNSTGDFAREGQVRALAVVDGAPVQAESSFNQTGRRRRRSEDVSLEVSEKPEIGVPNVFVIQAKRSRA